MTEILPFNGTDIRTAQHERQTVAYMPDVAASFGLRSDNVVRELDPWDFISAGQDGPSDLRGHIDPLRPQNASPYWLTESGIWHLAYRLSAELRYKVNAEMLPALRKAVSPSVSLVSRPPAKRRTQKLGIDTDSVNFLLSRGVDRFTLTTADATLTVEADQERVPAHVHAEAELAAKVMQDKALGYVVAEAQRVVHENVRAEVVAGRREMNDIALDRVAYVGREAERVKKGPDPEKQKLIAKLTPAAPATAPTRKALGSGFTTAEENGVSR